MVPMGYQEYYGVVRGLWGLHWDLCNGRGPHLVLRREPQGSSPVLTWVSGVYAVSNRESGFDLCGGKELCYPIELSKGFQDSRQVDFGAWGSFRISNRGTSTPFML